MTVPTNLVLESQQLRLGQVQLVVVTAHRNVLVAIVQHIFGNQILKLGLGTFRWHFHDVSDDDHVGKVDTEFAQQFRHISLLSVKFGFLVDQGKDSKFTVLPERVDRNEVRQQQSETTVVVQPPHVNEALLLGGKEARIGGQSLAVVGRNIACSIK